MRAIFILSCVICVAVARPQTGYNYDSPSAQQYAPVASASFSAQQQLQSVQHLPNVATPIEHTAFAGQNQAASFAQTPTAAAALDSSQFAVQGPTFTGFQGPTSAGFQGPTATANQAPTAVALPGPTVAAPVEQTSFAVQTPSIATPVQQTQFQPQSFADQTQRFVQQPQSFPQAQSIAQVQSVQQVQSFSQPQSFAQQLFAAPVEQISFGIQNQAAPVQQTQVSFAGHNQAVQQPSFAIQAPTASAALEQSQFGGPTAAGFQGPTIAAPIEQSSFAVQTPSIATPVQQVQFQAEFAAQTPTFATPTFVQQTHSFPQVQSFQQVQSFSQPQSFAQQSFPVEQISFGIQQQASPAEQTHFVQSTTFATPVEHFANQGPVISAPAEQTSFAGLTPNNATPIEQTSFGAEPTAMLESVSFAGQNLPSALVNVLPSQPSFAQQPESSFSTTFNGLTGVNTQPQANFANQESTFANHESSEARIVTSGASRIQAENNFAQEQQPESVQQNAEKQSFESRPVEDESAQNVSSDAITVEAPVQSVPGETQLPIQPTQPVQLEQPALTASQEIAVPTATIHKHVYVHVPPPEFEDTDDQFVFKQPGSPSKHYKIVFIKAPSLAPKASVIQQQLQSLNEEKTLIYVLVKKPEYNANDLVTPQIRPKQNKPEVFYVKYNTQKDGSTSTETPIAIDERGTAEPQFPALEEQNAIHANEASDDNNQNEVNDTELKSADLPQLDSNELSALSKKYIPTSH